MFLFLFSHASIGPRVPRGPHKNDKARDEKSVKKGERKNSDREPFWGSITAFSLAASWVELSINIYWANLFAGAAWKRLSLGLDSFSLFIFFWFIFWFYVVDVMDFFFCNHLRFHGQWKWSQFCLLDSSSSRDEVVVVYLCEPNIQEHIFVVNIDGMREI